MFLLTVVAYPAALAALCGGAGLLADRVSGGYLPGALLATVGAASLIAATQLLTYLTPLAPATPYIVAALALAGWLLGARRARVLLRGLARRPWPVLVMLLSYLIAIAPVLLAGRPSFSSYQALADSAVHMLGADFLIRHGQDYAHLDLRNSYGQFVNDYYNAGYPSGADTLLGASARLLRLPLIWTFQPFNAFMLALATGPAWRLARGMRLAPALAALAALTATVPALVYAYELLGSVKEITALTLILTLGCLAVMQRRWLRGPPRRVLPFALVSAAGISSLGVAFAAWALVATALLVPALLVALARHGRARTRAIALVAVGVLTLLVAAWPTWAHLSGSLQLAQNIASTGNAGNLHTPLRASQVLGVWLRGSYKLSPHGASLLATDVLIALVALAAALGALWLARIRAYGTAAWIGLMLLAWGLVSASVTTWAGAKTLMLTSPAVLLLAWGGVASLQRRVLVSVAALATAGGVLASDALQYHSSNLAPTARYEELASLNSRFRGRGPALFTDFDEYSLYLLRDLDVGGPDFVYPPPALASLAGGYGRPVALDRAAPSSLRAYPLIITRRDPTASRPPAAYALLWSGAYYEVWGRRAHTAASALAHVRLDGGAPSRCATLGRLASMTPTGRLIAARAPALLALAPSSARRPERWGREREGVVMSSPGQLSTSFELPRAGVWQLWLQGQIMPSVTLAVDGRRVAVLGGQLGGNSLVPDTIGPFSVTLAAGAHVLRITRHGFTLAPGNGGSAVLDAILVTSAGAERGQALTAVPARRWRELCRGRYEWVESLAA
jgi:hypothetical protein